MSAVTHRRLSWRHVIYAHLPRLSSWLRLALGLVAALRASTRGRIKPALLRLVHLLPHEATEHYPQHLGQHVPYKYEKQQQPKREGHELSEKSGNLRVAGG